MAKKLAVSMKADGERGGVNEGWFCLKVIRWCEFIVHSATPPRQPINPLHQSPSREASPKSLLLGLLDPLGLRGTIKMEFQNLSVFTSWRTWKGMSGCGEVYLLTRSISRSGSPPSRASRQNQGDLRIAFNRLV